MSDTGTVLDIDGLSIDLHVGSRTTQVVRNVTAQVREGETLGVVGESGSGKSLTALATMGMLPSAAEVRHGRVLYRGQDLLHLSEHELRTLRGDRLGMVFQDPQASLNPLMTVGQQIREVLTLHGATKRQADLRAKELLSLVGIDNASRRVDDYPHQFSGGMRQRVVIAMAVANDPSLLIADEPTSALDVTVQAEILDLLNRLRDELGMGMVIITHDFGVVQEICDSVLVMYAGRSVEYGQLVDVLGDPRHPYTQALMQAAPRLDTERQSRLPTIPGVAPDLFGRPDGCAFHPRCPLALDTCATNDPPLIDCGRPTEHLAACIFSADPLPPPEPIEVQEVAAEPSRGNHDERIVEVIDAHLSYDGRRSWLPGSRAAPTVVHGVSLCASAGSAIGLVGESGSGKSTLARAMVGLLTPTAGSVTVLGRDWRNLRRAARRAMRRTVQMVFQDPYSSLNPRQTVNDTLTEPIVVHDLLPASGLQRRVAELVDLVGLPKSVVARYPYQLSGGQRQRVAIARSLALEPKLIVADEPVSALDVAVQAQIVNLLADLRDDLGLGLVVIGHDLSVVRNLCDEVAVMKDGVVVETNRTDELFANPQHEYTNKLIKSSPTSGLL